MYKIRRLVQMDVAHIPIVVSVSSDAHPKSKGVASGGSWRVASGVGTGEVGSSARPPYSKNNQGERDARHGRCLPHRINQRLASIVADA
jgi:hypothetical protein